MFSRAWVVAAAGLLAAGCGNAAATVTVTSPSAGAAATVQLQPSSSSTTCTVFLSGHAANVVFESDTLEVEPECRNWIQTAAQRGDVWTEDPQSTVADQNVSGGGTVCVLEDSQGNARATVNDQGFATYGQSACTQLIAAGWIQQ